MLWRALLSGDLQSAFITLALSLPAIVLCLSVHEAAHGGMAYLLGDRTAHDSGRMTLSPMAHIDPFGFLCLLLFGFGWARPVPVNISNFKNRRWGMALTALAGPAANFITAFIAYCLYVSVWMYGTSAFMQTVGMFLSIVASMSVGLGVFNLIPVHPLDGSRVLDAFLAVFVVAQAAKVSEYHSAGVHSCAVARLAGRDHERGFHAHSASGAAAGQPVLVRVARHGISLENFDGPLDLLLHLIAKNKVSIYDIPIAEILDQYMEVLHAAEAMDLDCGGRF